MNQTTDLSTPSGRRWFYQYFQQRLSGFASNPVGAEEWRGVPFANLRLTPVHAAVRLACNPARRG